MTSMILVAEAAGQTVGHAIGEPTALTSLRIDDEGVLDVASTPETLSTDSFVDELGRLVGSTFRVAAIETVTNARGLAAVALTEQRPGGVETLAGIGRGDDPVQAERWAAVHAVFGTDRPSVVRAGVVRLVEDRLVEAAVLRGGGPDEDFGAPECRTRLTELALLVSSGTQLSVCTDHAGYWAVALGRTTAALRGSLGTEADARVAAWIRTLLEAVGSRSG
jgi:hypothetical protein